MTAGVPAAAAYASISLMILKSVIKRREITIKCRAYRLYTMVRHKAVGAFWPAYFGYCLLTCRLYMRGCGWVEYI